jgi:hypothetical protein
LELEQASLTRGSWSMTSRHKVMFSTAFLDLPPLASASGTVTLPGSKSISNRVLLLSALCQGTTTSTTCWTRTTPASCWRHCALGCGIRRRRCNQVDDRRPGGQANCTGQSCSWAMPAPPCAPDGGAWRCWVAISSSAALRACTSARLAIWWMRCASWAARSTTWAKRWLPAPAHWQTGTERLMQPIGCVAMCPASS